MITDPIANMLSSINNANRVNIHFTTTPLSKIKLLILEILKKHAFIKDYRIDEENKKIKINLLYVNGKPVLTKLKKISKPGLRVYTDHQELPVVLNNAGIAIISTSKGIMSNLEAKKRKLGGEVIAYAW